MRRAAVLLEIQLAWVRCASPGRSASPQMTAAIRSPVTEQQPAAFGAISPADITIASSQSDALRAGLADAGLSGRDGQFRVGDKLREVFGLFGHYIATENSK